MATLVDKVKNTVLIAGTIATIGFFGYACYQGYHTVKNLKEAGESFEKDLDKIEDDITKKFQKGMNEIVDNFSTELDRLDDLLTPFVYEIDGKRFMVTHNFPRGIRYDNLLLIDNGEKVKYRINFDDNKDVNLRYYTNDTEETYDCNTGKLLRCEIIEQKPVKGTELNIVLPIGSCDSQKKTVDEILDSCAIYNDKMKQMKKNEGLINAFYEKYWMSR